MQYTFFTPGPTEPYPTVREHIIRALDLQITSISHRSDNFRSIYRDTAQALKVLLGVSANTHVFFGSSATEWMERIIQNCVAKRSIHFVNGAFSDRFYRAAIELGKDPVKIEAPFGEAFSLDKIPVDDEIELVCITYNETSSGVMLKAETIEHIKARFPNALVAIDVVSAAPYLRFDADRADMLFSSVQKGLGMPSGLGFLIVNDRALAKQHMLAQQGIITGSYHSFASLLSQEEKRQTPETPNVLSIYVLGKVCEDMLDKGVETIHAETEEKATYIYDVLEAHAHMAPFVSDRSIRSQTVITASVQDGSAAYIERMKQAGYMLGAGYKEYKGMQLRIANFPAHSVEQTHNMIQILKTI
jgi:phosphoserine aminotransferase